MSDILTPQSQQPWHIDQLLKLAAGHFINNVREACVSRAQDPLVKEAVNGIASGLGNVVNAAIDQHPGIPHQPLDAVQIAQHVGILPRERKQRNPRKGNQAE